MVFSLNTHVRRAAAAAALLFVAGAAAAQNANVIDLSAATGAPAVNLTAQRMVTQLPDGTTAPMWGYCATGYSLDGANFVVPGAKTTEPKPCATTGTAGWMPGPTIIVKAGTSAAPATLPINLTNNLPTPTSLVVLGQLGGGLGTPNRVPSPSHATQNVTTWNGNFNCTTGAPCKPFVPPKQSGRVMSFGAEAPLNGGTAALSWTNLKPGTYLYETGTHPSIQAPMGLHGWRVVTSEPVFAAGVAPAAGTVVAGQAFPGAYPNLGTPGVPQLSVGNTPLINVGYDADAVMLLSEIDAVQNSAVDAAAGVACGAALAAPGSVGVCAGVLNESSYPAAVNYAPTYFLLNGWG